MAQFQIHGLTFDSADFYSDFKLVETITVAGVQLPRWAGLHYAGALAVQDIIDGGPTGGRWHAVTGAPPPALGRLGDMALDASGGPTHGTVWSRGATDWTEIGNISGPADTPLSDALPAALAEAAAPGAGTAAARDDHVHPRPTAAEVGAVPATAIGAPDGVAGLGPDGMVDYTAARFAVSAPATPLDATHTLDPAAGEVQALTLGAATVITAPNPPAGQGYSVTLKLIQDATGTRAPTVQKADATPARWMGGDAPTWQTAAGAFDLVVLTHDGTDLLAAHVGGLE